MVLYVGAGILLVGISIPLIQRRIKPNPLYGFRVPKAYKSDEIWYDINAYSGMRLLVGGIVIAIAGVLLAAVPGMDINLYAILMVVVLFVVLGVGLWQSLRYLNQISQ